MNKITDIKIPATNPKAHESIWAELLEISWYLESRSKKNVYERFDVLTGKISMALSLGIIDSVDSHIFVFEVRNYIENYK